MEDEPPEVSPLPRADPPERSQIDDLARAEAAQAAALARVAMRFGALDDRLLRGPDGWRQRLAMIEVARLSWLIGERVTVDRIGLWVSLRISAVQQDTAALQRSAWALRRLVGGPGPDAGLATFLGRHPGNEDSGLDDRLGGWLEVMEDAAHLHPLTRACLGFRLWRLAGQGGGDETLEGAVIAMRLAALDGQGGALFVPLATGGSGVLSRSGAAMEQLAFWLDRVEQAILSAHRALDRIEAWHIAAVQAIGGLSGRTPPMLVDAFRDWPHLSAPMAERLTGASRAAVQRNLIWMQENDLITEMTGQGRFRMWRARE